MPFQVTEFLDENVVKVKLLRPYQLALYDVLTFFFSYLKIIV